MPAAIPARRAFVVFIACAMALSLVATLAVPVRAATITVTANAAEADDGACSLREAIEAANTNLAVDACVAGEAEPVVDSISVPAGTYTLALGYLNVDESVAIVGAGAATTIIDGNDDDRVFNLDEGDVAISNVTISGGFASDVDGGGIFVENDATLNLTTSIVIDNHATDAGSGGGIAIERDGATATISGSTVGTPASPNTAGEDGGGIYVGEGSTLTLTGSTVSGNTALDDGGGIFVDDDAVVGVDETIVTISGSTVSGNTAEDGGGIYVDDDASVAMSASTISGNSADFEGGGLSVDFGATLNLSAATNVSGNTATRGGGIYVNDGGTANLSATTVGGTNAAEFGGGIYVDEDGVLNLVSSTVTGNTADSDGEVGGFGGGIWTTIGVSLLDSTVSGNTADVDGGGIYQGVASTGVVDVDASTISGNTAGGEGGGIWSEATVMLHNSTVSGNTAAGDGGGVNVDGTLESDFSTVASNASTDGEGGGIWTQGHATFYASIVGNNTAGGDCLHNDTGVESLGSNLDSDDTCNFNQTSDKPDTDPKLGPLADNGGPTLTHALLFDSPAVDAVAAAVPVVQAEFLLAALVDPTCPATDQRGGIFTRPQDGDSDGVAVCDIGAYELLPPAASITDVSVTEGNSGTVDAVFTVTLSRASTGTVTFAYATADGTATVVADYQAATGTVTFVPGDTSETITVRVVGDTIDEPNETFSVNLTAPVGGTILDAQGIGTILDDDGAPAPGPVQTPTPAAGQLPDTGTAGMPLEGWGAPGLAILILAVSAGALIRARRKQATRPG